MIRLAFLPRPDEMTDNWVAEQTDRFIQDSTLSVWNKPFIKDCLLQMSNNKCSYCECKLGIEDKYIEVEHFLPKSKYPNRVLEWENLLPSCKRCNSEKREFDPAINPFIHPVHDEPKDHLAYIAYRFTGKTEKGKNSIFELNLNDRTRLQTPRFEIASAIIEQLDDIQHDIEEALFEVKSLTKFVTRLKNLCNQGLPNNQYSSIIATELIRAAAFNYIKAAFNEFGLWDIELQDLEIHLRNIAFLD
ncbi:MAG: HNH endonuclease [Saprospiraceae bacterium]|nr:HNH endonuclease [Saprospiraceae bacterium]